MKRTRERLVRIVAPHFVAGVVLRGELVVGASDIVRYAIGRNADWLRAYVRRRGWRAHVVRLTPSDDTL